MKFFVITSIFAATVLGYAAELVTATVATGVRKNDSFFSTGSLLYSSDAATDSGIVDANLFKITVGSTYVNKTTQSYGSNIFRVKAQLFGASITTPLLLSNGKTFVLSSEFAITHFTGTPAINKNTNVTLTPAGALLASVDYVVRITIERSELVNGANAWVNDVASMIDDFPIADPSTVSIPQLKVAQFANQAIRLSYASQQPLPWKLQSSTTLSSGSFSDVSGVTFLLDEDTDRYEANVPVNTATQPKRFFRLVAP
jgi:hypothetical protein